MDKLNEMIADLKQLDESLDALLDNETLTEEQRTEHDAFVARREKLTADINKERDRLSREQQRAVMDAEAETTKAKAEEIEADKKAKEERAEERKKRLVVPVRPLSTPDFPKPEDSRSAQVWIVPAGVRRYGSLKNFSGERDGRGAEERSYRFGMWAQHLLASQLPGRYHFPLAESFVKKNMLVHQTNNATGAHNLIPEEFSTDIIDLRERYGLARRVFRIEKMTSDTKVVPRRIGGLIAYPVGEAQPGTESNKVWDQVRLVAKDWMVLSRYTAQVEADSVINFGDDLAGEIAQAFALAEDQAAFNGTGTSTYNGISGVRYRLDNVDGAGTDSLGLVTQGTSNTWSAIVLGDFEAVLGLVPQYAEMGEMYWIAHKAFYFNVMARLQYAVGGTQPMDLVSGTGISRRPNFLGYPVEFSSVFPSTTAVATVACTFGNYRMGAAFGDRQLDRIAFSEHASVGGESVFERNEIAIRGTERFDINVHDVGSAAAAGPIGGLKTGA